MTPARSVTLKDIAAVAGVSTAAVSQALNDAGNLSDETRERVKQVAASLGYVPNRAAAALRRGRSRSIGFVVDETDDDDFGERRAVHRTRLFNALVRESARHDYTVTVLPASRPELLRGSNVDVVYHPGTDGLVEISAEALSLGMRVVANDLRVDGPGGVSIRTGYDAAVRAGLDLLAEGGAERIGFLVGDSAEPRNRIGEHAYRSWCLERERERFVAEVDASGRGLTRAINDLVGIGVDALFTFTEDGPEAFLHLEATGVVMPRDVQLITMCTLDCALNDRLGVTHVCVHPERSPEALFEVLDTRPPLTPPSIVELPWELAHGSTTRR